MGHVVEGGGHAGEVRRFGGEQDHAGVGQVGLGDPEESARLKGGLGDGVALVRCGDDAAAVGVGDEECGDEGAQQFRGKRRAGRPVVGEDQAQGKVVGAVRIAAVQRVVRDAVDAQEQRRTALGLGDGIRARRLRGCRGGLVERAQRPVGTQDGFGAVPVRRRCG